MNSVRISKKVCMLGMFGVGKTSLTRRFVEGIYNDNYLSTIGVKVSQKLLSPRQITPGRLCQINLLIWDIEGFENESHQLKNYLVGTAGALLIGDLTRPETIETLPNIYQTYRQINPDGEAIVLGNKSDLVEPNAESLQLLKRIVASLSLNSVITSAKSGQHVEAAFDKLGSVIAQ